MEPRAHGELQGAKTRDFHGCPSLKRVGKGIKNNIEDYALITVGAFCDATC
jgi:hypothetical protein